MTTPTLIEAENLAHELDGVIADVEAKGFDAVCLATVKRVRDAIAQGEQMPEGYVIVPKVCTRKMAIAAWGDVTNWEDFAAQYAKAIAAASPTPPAEQPAEQPVNLSDNEQYRMQMAGISTAALGYWKDGDTIHPDYDTVPLRDVAKLYAAYDKLYKAAQPVSERSERCHAGSDGDCIHKNCPQLRDGEPHKSGRHCPLDK